MTKTVILPHSTKLVFIFFWLYLFPFLLNAQQVINGNEMEPQDVQISLTVDWDALKNLLAGSEAPYEVMNFGQASNVSNADYTTVVAPGDHITFNPKFSSSGDTILYLGIEFDPGFNAGEYLEQRADLVVGNFTLDIILNIINGDANDVVTKYDILFQVGTRQGRFGPFKIDPKLRIPGQ